MNTLPINSIINGECVSEIKKLPDSYIGLIIADPPYNLSKGGEWNDFTFESYIAFTKAWLTEAKRILKPAGSMWIFGTYHNMGFINVICQMLGIEIINEVVWYKRHAFPNLAGRRRRENYTYPQNKLHGVSVKRENGSPYLHHLHGKTAEYRKNNFVSGYLYQEVVPYSVLLMQKCPEVTLHHKNGQRVREHQEQQNYSKQEWTAKNR